MKKSNILFHISWLSAVYFLLILINAYFTRFTFVLVGVIQELITLPLIFVQPAICVLSLTYWTNDRFKIRTYSFWAFFISFCSAVLTIGSLVMA